MTNKIRITSLVVTLFALLSTGATFFYTGGGAQPPAALTDCTGISGGILEIYPTTTTSLTKSGGGHPSTNGDLISAFTDLSPAANNGSQATSSLYPAWYGSQINGKAVIRFAPSPNVSGFTIGTTQLMQSGSGFTAYMVAKLNSTSSTNRMWNTVTDVGGAGNTGVFATIGSTTISYSGGGGTKFPFNNSQTLDTTNFHRFVITYNGSGFNTLANFTVYYDKVSLSLTSNNQGHGDTATAIGYDGDAGDGGAGQNSFDMPLLCMWNSQLSTTDLSRMDSFTNTLFGI